MEEGPATPAERLRAWVAGDRSLGLVALKVFNQTLANWMADVSDHFVARPSNNRTKGFNR